MMAGICKVGKPELAGDWEYASWHVLKIIVPKY